MEGQERRSLDFAFTVSLSCNRSTVDDLVATTIGRHWVLSLAEFAKTLGVRFKSLTSHLSLLPVPCSSSCFDFQLHGIVLTGG